MIDDEYVKQVRQVKERIKDIRENGEELDLEEVEEAVKAQLDALRTMLDLGGGDVFLVERDAEEVAVEPFDLGEKKKRKEEG